jgi:hypothetical protein
MVSDDVVDLTDDSDFVRPLTTAVPATADVASEPSGKDVDELLRGDEELQALQSRAAEAHDIAFHRQVALSDALNDARRLDRLVSKRTKELVDAAERRIDWIGRDFPWDGTQGVWQAAKRYWKKSM